ncbi:type III secretion exporter [Desulfotomaculum nigrificans CO-1-SRB]|uniref:Type III secretion exporter n=1 Tax=Desulfotomaculum nigrificans (strain DSM 14880 / VKM B-2319 / CO-1-SRB) TaxID=868595 RepID=F6B5T1_DESCC|nr:EscU/YscU/HrcU family type III secretion system export apparatus switch protein [Desulfotomaculum nigrificans]AEF93154.1 type III secretion exporter [Desulfotomaculum nigrificans CO-1-SRB]
MAEDRVKLAAALRYRHGEDAAPVVVAAGKGELATAIEKIAREHNIPVYQDQHLARTLTELGLGVEIPPELYEVVAKILVHVAALDGKFT